MISRSIQKKSNFVTAEGFSLVELLLSVAIIALLSTGGLAAYRYMRVKAGTTVSIKNLKGLVHANLAYALDHGGAFCPAQDRRNLKRWHGGRKRRADPFDPAQGFLSPYFGKDGAVQICPLMNDQVQSKESFETNAGGYGYNAAYIGGKPGQPWQSANTMEVDYAGRVIMFATTALSRKKGVQEYPYTEPYFWPTSDGGNGGSLQPSTHFRAAGGKAIIGWCDGTVTLEGGARHDGPNFYDGDNARDKCGWFGPEEGNGYWNPMSPVAQGLVRDQR